MITAGLTGNYGMGKSSVLALFRSLGAATLDSDLIVAELLEDRKVLAGMKRILGADVIDPQGRLDKRAAAREIFGSDESRKAVERFLHPMVIGKIKKEIAGLRGKSGVVIVEVPLLFEGGYGDQFDKTITVYTSMKTAVSRLAESGVTRSGALERLRVQMPVALKKKKADFTINNNGSRGETRRQVESIYRILQQAEDKD